MFCMMKATVKACKGALNMTNVDAARAAAAAAGNEDCSALGARKSY
jgi:hypothetical protein